MVRVWNWCPGAREVWGLRSWELLQSQSGAWINPASSEKSVRLCRARQSRRTKWPCRTMWWIFLGRGLCPNWKYVFISGKWSNKATFVVNRLKIKRDQSSVQKEGLFNKLFVQCFHRTVASQTTQSWRQKGNVFCDTQAGRGTKTGY